MATSKCVYPYPVLVIRQAATVEWAPAVRATHVDTGAIDFYGELQPVTRDVRLSFYQTEGKPWDWARARRLADACYRSHGELSIEDPLGQVWLDGEQPAEHAPRAKAPNRMRDALQAIIEAGRMSDQPRAIYCAEIARAALATAASHA